MLNELKKPKKLIEKPRPHIWNEGVAKQRSQRKCDNCDRNLFKILVKKLEARVTELDANLELSSEEIFDIVCQEFQIDANSIVEELDCKCPFALVGYMEVSGDE